MEAKDLGPKSALSTFFSNPLVGIIGSIASIVGIFLAIYFYKAGQEKPELTYYVSPVKAVLARTGQASRLSTLFDNKIITSDITVAQVAIWNEGNKPIKVTDILKPIVIYTDNNNPILEASIRKTSRDVVNIGLNMADISKGKLNISWNIFEKNDGGVIQLIYAGDTSVGIQMDGVIEGQGTIRQIRFHGKIMTPEQQYVMTQKENYYIPIFMIIGGGIIAIMTIYILITKPIVFRESPRFIYWSLIIIPWLTIGGGLYSFFTMQEKGPPFGF